jgi:hypothetical protein
VGAKVVGRDKMQDQQPTTRARGVHARPIRIGRLWPEVSSAGRRVSTDHQPSGDEGLFNRTRRFVSDPLTSEQNSLQQDFTASEAVYATYGMIGLDFAKWHLMAGVRVEATAQGDEVGRRVGDDGVEGLLPVGHRGV